jgi:PadR family transcriptional regulator PadR
LLRDQSDGTARRPTPARRQKLTIHLGPNIPENESVKKEETKNVQSEIMQGTLDLLVLKAVGPGPLHGLGVSRRIEQITNGTFSVKPGSLFPALHRIEAAGWLHSFWGRSENNRRARFYQLTKAGRRQLEVETAEWENIAVAMSAALNAA